ncbi:hypothetical protein BJ684DRAFT_19551 [Piptocephalis cylindrospora]|uniref:DUF2423 domain-containing protein n=1 Tax=Piptocephalis cylindrospora TaxID=1907219 RepID=A0A4P9Y4X4_9FUNG|nr:hypothetical protein BJ684DRAFT_19551 [Piptocephalis cylindrospora]|eukprot:RKP14007.1 hypothetical protein BJ684DRAFT_19551 [Piptocephalis cylindrospora]
MAKSIRASSKRHFRSVKRATLFGQVEAERLQRLAKLQEAANSKTHREYTGLSTAEEEKTPIEKVEPVKEADETMQEDGATGGRTQTRDERKRKYKKGCKVQSANTLRGSKKFRNGQVKKTKKFVF